MKLVKIEDVRVGQIWKDSHWNLALVKDVSIKTNMLSLWIKNYDIPSTEEKNTSLNFFSDNGMGYKLIGKLGITHEIKDNRLVEIKTNDKVDYDDVVTYFDFDHCENIGVVISIYDRDEYISYGFITDKGIYDTDECFEHEEIGEDTGIYTYTPTKIGILGVTHEFVNERLVK